LWDLTAKLLPLGVFTASLLGSLHCVGMCGPFLLLFPATGRNHTLYHGARLLAYSGFGAVAGAIGSGFLHEGAARWLSLSASAFLALVFVVLGISVMRERPLHPPALLSGLHPKLFRFQNPFAIGLSSVLLPCGWLYAFVAAAAATGHPLNGALTMLLFWLGTVPALSIGPAILKPVLMSAGKRAPRLSGVILLSLGLLLFFLKLSPLLSVKPVTHEKQEICPFHQE